MMATKWVLTPLLVTVLVTWTGAFAQATDQGQANNQDRAISDQPLGPSPTAVDQEKDVTTEKEITIEGKEKADGSREIEMKREVETEAPAGMPERRAAMRRDVQKEDTELRKWGELEPAGPPREGMAARPPATQPGPEAARQPADVDIFLFEEPGGPRGYWAPPARGGIYGYRGEPGWRRGQIYGYEEGARGPAPSRMGAVVEPVPQHASHNWSEGRNLVDDNLIQTRDGFDDPGDFYTKEWKIAAPPLVAHPRFHTIYDSELTQRYYTSWHGSPVNWAPNMMVEVPLPPFNHEWYSSRQLATYFTPWKKGEFSKVPTYSETAGRTYATRGFGPEVYGYRGEEFEGPGTVSRDGAFFYGRQPLYFDDQDVTRGVVRGEGVSGGILGYVSPEAETGDVTIERGVGANMHLNEPWSTGVSIYGVPTGPREETAVTVEPQPDVYGYVGEEEHGMKAEHKVKKEKAGKECKPGEAKATTEHRIYGYEGEEDHKAAEEREHQAKKERKSEKEYKADKECKDKSHEHE